MPFTQETPRIEVRKAVKIVKILLIKNLAHYPTKDFKLDGQFWNSYNFLDI